MLRFAAESPRLIESRRRFRMFMLVHGQEGTQQMKVYKSLCEAA
jgi:hypothetical protein